MFVDEGTRLLDPTCGSGAALRAAEDLGAQMVLGLERDPEHASAAKSALRQFRALKRASGGKA
jgi:predicted RNA methylase